MTMSGESSGKASGNRKRKVGLLYDERMCKHDTPYREDHPECPNRIKVIWEKLQLTGLAQRCVVLGGIKAEDKHLQLVHAKKHVNLVKRLSTKKKDSRRDKIASQLDSIYLNGSSSEAAYLAAGSVVEVAEKVAKGELDRGFAIVRPPGHHAEEDEARGFCLFNNVAVAASYLVNERPDLGIRKILIVDWDVHHGNGTQKMFWNDPRVLVFSVHRHDGGNFYPTGDDGDYDKVGEGPGEGFNINVPWDLEQGQRCGDGDYFAVWDRILIPVTKEFDPDIILVSAGFDTAIGDPLGGCSVTPCGYSVMLAKLKEFAKGKIVMALEGGYNLDSVAKSSLACVQVLLEDKPIQGSSSEEYPLDSTRRVIQAVCKRLCAYWPSLADELPWKEETPTPVCPPFPLSLSPNFASAQTSLFKTSSSDVEEVLESIFRNLECSIQERYSTETKLTILSIRDRKQAESLRASLEEKAAFQTRVAELQLSLKVILDEFIAEVKEAAEHSTQVCSELREIKIDVAFQRECFKKASEKKKSLESQIIKLGSELEKEASDTLCLQLLRCEYAAEVIEAAEQLVKVGSELRKCILILLSTSSFSRRPPKSSSQS